MATYVVGDVHGCYRTFKRLLCELDFRETRDTLWFVGDLVNKGSGSLDMLRWAADHDDRIVTVLGNHDLHLLSCHYGLREQKESDTLEPILRARDVEELTGWLASRPFLVSCDQWMLVHAGILPGWSLDEAQTLAESASRILSGTPLALLRPLNRDQERSGIDMKGIDESRPHWISRVFTLIRTCHGPFQPDFDYSGPPESAPRRTRPWYEFPQVAHSGKCFLFGHWARHGFRQSDHWVCLDSGCVYDGVLTAMRLEDRKIYQVPSIE